MVHRLIGQKWLANICRGTGERREEGGGRRKGGRNREEGGRRFEGRNRDFPVVLGVQGGSLGALERCLGGLGWSSGVPGVLLGDPWGLFGSSWALPRGPWDVFWGAISMYKDWSFSKKKEAGKQKVGKV